MPGFFVFAKEQDGFRSVASYEFGSCECQSLGDSGAAAAGDSLSCGPSVWVRVSGVAGVVSAGLVESGFVASGFAASGFAASGFAESGLAVSDLARWNWL